MENVVRQNMPDYSTSKIFFGSLKYFGILVVVLIELYYVVRFYIYQKRCDFNPLVIWGLKTYFLSKCKNQ